MAVIEDLIPKGPLLFPLSDSSNTLFMVHEFPSEFELYSATKLYILHTIYHLHCIWAFRESKHIAFIWHVKPKQKVE